MCIQVHATQASAASHTAATDCMLFMMSRAVLTSGDVENNICKETASACRDLLRHLCRKTLCAEHSSKACAKESLAFAQERQGVWVGTVCW